MNEQRNSSQLKLLKENDYVKQKETLKGENNFFKKEKRKKKKGWLFPGRHITQPM